MVRQATRNDDRVTRLGKFLRKSSIDELPQLFNVISGDMSLVGPRPHALAHDTYYSGQVTGYRDRFAALPGITGWAQINGARGETPQIEDMKRRVGHDLWYIRNQSFALDMQILFKTLKIVFVNVDAY